MTPRVVVRETTPTPFRCRTPCGRVVELQAGQINNSLQRGGKGTQAERSRFLSAPALPTRGTMTPHRSFLRRRATFLAPIGVALVALIAWLAIGYFGVHTLFFDTTVDEQVLFDSGATQAPRADKIELAAPADVVLEPAAATDIVSLAAGRFEGRAHRTEGRAVVLNDGTDQRILSLEDFGTDNGPDLNVYLVRDGDVSSGFVDLGDLKGNVGDQNYEIPADVDLSEYDTVVIWCVRFGVNFGQARLSTS